MLWHIYINPRHQLSSVYEEKRAPYLLGGVHHINSKSFPERFIGLSFGLTIIVLSLRDPTPGPHGISKKKSM